MSRFVFAQKLDLYKPKKFSWTAVMENGELIGGYSATLGGCEKAAEKYAPLQYFVAGPTPMDWPKYFSKNNSALDTNELIVR